MPRKSTLPNSHADLFRRHATNPILTSQDWPYPAHTVFNAGACQLGRETILLVRVEDRRGHSHLTVARSEDGVSNWRIDPRPSFARTQDIPGRTLGRGRPASHLGAGTQRMDHRVYGVFSQWTHGLVGQHQRLFLLHPPRAGHASRRQRCSRLSTSLRRTLCHDPSTGFRRQFRRAHLAVLFARPHALGRPPRAPSRTTRCLVGCQQDRSQSTAAGNPRRLAAALSRRAAYSRRVHLPAGPGAARSGKPLAGTAAKRRMDLRPEMPYERHGDVNGVVFPCGWVLDPDSGTIRMYYGGADSCLALATAQLSDVLEYLRSCPAPPLRQRMGIALPE